MKTNIEELNSIYEKIKLVEKNDIPTIEQVESFEKWANLQVERNGTETWDSLLQNAQGELQPYKEGLDFMINSNEFIKYSQSCEYGYIINLDTHLLEFWQGLQREPQENNRYGIESDENGYYPCKLILSFSIEDISETAILLMEVTSNKN